MKVLHIFLFLFIALWVYDLSAQDLSVEMRKNLCYEREKYEKIESPDLNDNLKPFRELEVLLDSSINFSFTNNYDSISHSKNHYHYYESGLRKKWEFYKKGWIRKGQQWYVDFYFEFTYDDNENMVESRSTHWIESLQEYKPYRKGNAVFDSNNNRVEAKYYQWDIDEKEWYIIEENYWEYDSLGNNIYYERWSYEFHHNGPLHRYFMSYDENNNLIENLRHVWDRHDSTWKNLDFLSYQYDYQQNNVLFTVSHWNKYLEYWWEVAKEEIDYNTENLRTSRSFYERDSDTLEWQIQDKFNYEYSYDNKLIRFTKLKWLQDSMRLVNAYKNDYEYDDNGFVKNDYLSGWLIDTIQSRWVFYWNNFKINDSLGNILVSGTEKLDSLGNWYYQIKDYFYYSSLITDIDEQTHWQFNVSPNPGKGIFEINSNAFIEKINVYDLYARQIIHISLNLNWGTIDLSDYQSGKYIIRLTFQDGSKDSQIIVKL